MPVKKHLHVYRRIRQANSPRWGGTYGCQDAGCSSFSQHTILAGKKARCKCGQEFIIDPQIHFTKVELKCFSCMKGKTRQLDKAASLVLDEAFNVMNIGGVPIESTVMKLPEQQVKEQLELEIEEPEAELFDSDEFNDFDNEIGKDDAA